MHIINNNRKLSKDIREGLGPTFTKVPFPITLSRSKSVILAVVFSFLPSSALSDSITLSSSAGSPLMGSAERGSSMARNSRTAIKSRILGICRCVIVTIL